MRRDSNSGFLLGETGDTVNAERADAGIEKPTRDEVGREFGFEGDAASLRRRDAQEGFGAAGLTDSLGDCSADCSVGSTG